MAYDTFKDLLPISFGDHITRHCLWIELNLDQCERDVVVHTYYTTTTTTTTELLCIVVSPEKILLLREDDSWMSGTFEIIEISSIVANRQGIYSLYCPAIARWAYLMLTFYYFFQQKNHTRLEITKLVTCK